MRKPLVVILAGGTGSHFTPLITDKTLFPFMGKPLLQHTIEMVEQNGFSQALIVTNPRNEEWLGTYQPFNITLQTHQQHRQEGGMGQALLEIQDEIGHQPFLILNAVDVINPLFMKQLYRETLEEHSFVTGKKMDTLVPAGYIALQGDRASHIVEKPAQHERPSDLINLVFHFISRPDMLYQHLHTIPSSDCQYELALSEYMNTEHTRVITYVQDWSKLKYAYHVLDVMDTILKYRTLNHQARSAYISPLARIEGTVYIDENAHIDAYAIIKGPAYIGRGAKIGNHALVRQSTIEEGAIVGFGCEVARSYIGPRCMLHHNFIGDSVLESDVNPSWGTTTANLRLDTKPIRMKLPDGSHIQTDKTKLGAIMAKGVFLGVNCSIMPGVSIGTNQRVPPGTILKDSLGTSQ